MKEKRRQDSERRQWRNFRETPPFQILILVSSLGFKTSGPVIFLNSWIESMIEFYLPR